MNTMLCRVRTTGHWLGESCHHAVYIEDLYNVISTTTTQQRVTPTLTVAGEEARPWLVPGAAASSLLAASRLPDVFLP